MNQGLLVTVLCLRNNLSSIIPHDSMKDKNRFDSCWYCILEALAPNIKYSPLVLMPKSKPTDSKSLAGWVKVFHVIQTGMLHFPASSYWNPGDQSCAQSSQRCSQTFVQEDSSRFSFAAPTGNSNRSCCSFSSYNSVGLFRPAKMLYLCCGLNELFLLLFLMQYYLKSWRIPALESCIENVLLNKAKHWWLSAGRDPWKQREVLDLNSGLNRYQPPCCSHLTETEAETFSCSWSLFYFYSSCIV